MVYASRRHCLIYDNSQSTVLGRIEYRKVVRHQGESIRTNDNDSHSSIPLRQARSGQKLHLQRRRLHHQLLVSVDVGMLRTLTW